MDAPTYSYPAGVFAAFVRDLFLLRKRDFHHDAQACTANIDPPLKVFGQENIPPRGPCVITVNHYHRPGFGMQWIPLAVSSLIPTSTHWIMSGEFTYPGKWYEPLGTFGSQFLLKRIAHVYDFFTMPPMPPREKDVEARAASVRAVLEYVMCAEEPAPILGLAPEGYNASDIGVLRRPFNGVGRFGLLLSKIGLKFVPVGAYEVEGTFQLHFGEAYELRVARGLSTDEKDWHASERMIDNIARLLPVHLRGEFK
jgi:hypothetical protein